MTPICSRQLTIISLLLLALGLAACQQPGRKPAVAVSAEASEAAAVRALIEQARASSSPQAERLLIEAGRLLLEQAKPGAAERLVAAIDPAPLDHETRVQLVLLLADTYLARNQPEQAEELLTTDRKGLLTASSQLSGEWLNRISLKRAEAWEAMGNHLSAARERIFVDSMLSGEQAVANRQQIWNDLVALPADTLETLSSTVTVPEIQGWLQLAWIYKGLQDNLDQQLERLAQWQQAFPGHPANGALPEALQVIQQLSSLQPQQIALLLPTQGKFKAAGRAILNGFMSAYYVRASQGSPQSLPRIRVYDSATAAAFRTSYQQAVTDGAELIVGPLQKENLRLLLQSTDPLPVTTIALNQDYGQFESPPNLYQFALAPEDDAIAVARHGLHRQYEKAAVLYQDNPWWERAYLAFVEQWQADKGMVTAVGNFASGDKMAQAIQQMLLVQYSEQRARQLRNILGKPLEFQPRRRQDIDFIYLISTPEQARQIRPLLDFYYAQDIPVLAGSQIYSGEPNPKLDSDLNGIEFCDIPWLLENPDTIQQAFNRAWPAADHRYARLNAMGVDAYRLQSKLQLLTQIPDAGLFGATGNLSIGIDNKVKRELVWAVIKQGQPQLLPKVAPATDEPTAAAESRNEVSTTGHPATHHPQTGRQSG
ncbi:MAG: penicillin-binding protein activator [Pseudomonadota bacterium]|nr:hypothetical protein [Pseudomonadales bacterium]MDY6918917.1 penicillin-binding protein activator [Pseudomonadota bacterium]